MLDQVFHRPCLLSRLRASHFAALFDDYAGRLKEQGCCCSTIRSHIWAVDHFGTWLRSQPCSTRRVDQEAVRRFLVEHLPQCHCPAPAPTGLLSTRPGLLQLLRLLRDRGHLDADAAPPPAVTLVEQFRRHLRDICGLAEATCRLRVGYALEFLNGKFGRGPLQWDALNPRDIVAFLTGYTQRYQPASTQVVASALRSFLRYLQFQGWGTPALVAAVPRIAHWRLADLPKSMTDTQLDAFLGTFDRATATGRRDHAMALCQAYLGLRVSEVADLLLENLDWRAATMRVPTRKTGRSRELPLPRRVGEAIAAYLKNGRPATADRHVFVRHRRRQGTAVSPSLVGSVMALAFAKATGSDRWTGTHVLRHTAATRLHRRGANFKEIADLLGHQSLDTTFIYAKVDVPGLSAVVSPWPETLP